eukprot:CAMPEP_0185532578 /NCGR_PEP_ID=MMETSP1366-20130426/108016_1 /TAXON_ID=38817 /ORGANISM="Gephyrocapsa oceanica, Strain RCC1303" /LENGTH=697 /DNA_ID=CAMNT_0028144301 /DNA_START=2063 /DNA_END=4159 /DNA_ORIENTATION=-
MLEKLKLELVPAAGNKLVLKLSPAPPPLADKQVSLAGNTTINSARGEAADIQSEGEPASIEDGIQSEGEPASLEYVGVVFVASVSATLDSCAEASRHLTFTVDDPSCPPPPSPPPFVIDAAGGKADGISSESEPASFKDVIGDGGGTAVASEGESAPMAPVKACGVKNDHVVVVKEEATIKEAAAKSAAAEESAAVEAVAEEAPVLAASMPALVLILLAIACGASWPTAASGKGARGAASSATVCLAAATACLTGAVAVPAGFFASAFSSLAASPPKVAATVAALAVIGAVMWRRNSKARRFGWSSLLGVLLCLATVAGALVTAAGGAALVSSSTALPDVTAVLACESALNNTVVQKGALRQQSCIGTWTRTLLKGAWIPMRAKNLRGVFHGCIANDGGFPLTCIHRQSALRSRSESVLVLQPLNGTRAVAIGGPSKNVSTGEDPRVFVHGFSTMVLDNTRNAMRLLRLDVRRSLVTLEAGLPFAGKNLSPLTSYKMGEPLQLLDLQQGLLIKLELGGAAHIRQPTFDRVKLSYGNEHSQGPCECNGLDLGTRAFEEEPRGSPSVQVPPTSGSAMRRAMASPVTAAVAPALPVDSGRASPQSHCLPALQWPDARDRPIEPRDTHEARAERVTHHRRVHAAMDSKASANAQDQKQNLPEGSEFEDLASRCHIAGPTPERQEGQVKVDGALGLVLVQPL